MKKLVSLLSLALVGGVIATQPVMAQGTSKQQPTTSKASTTPKSTKASPKATVKSGNSAVAQNDTTKKAVKPVHKKHHKKHSTAAKKPEPKKADEK